MDKTAAKRVLSAYRPERGDADDPVFAEAARELDQDADLAAWFETEQRFDARMVEAFQEVPAPAELKDLILLNARSGGQAPLAARDSSGQWIKWVPAWLAIAAGLVLAFLLGQTLTPRSAPRLAANDGNGANRLALQAIDYTGKMPALQFVCFDASLVGDWINKKSAAFDMGKVIDKPMSRMQMIGSSTAQWEGKPVIMVALQNGEQMAMLYLVRAADFPAAADATGEIMEKDGWVSKTGRRGKDLYVLTTKGTRKNLDFPMPL